MTTRAAPSTRAPLPPSRPHPSIQPYLDAAARNRERAEALVHAIEESIREYAGLVAVPLDVAQRAAHAVVALNAANLTHVGAVPELVLGRADGAP